MWVWFVEKRRGESDYLSIFTQRPRVGEGDELLFQFTENLKLEREVDFRQHKSRRKLKSEK